MDPELHKIVRGSGGRLGKREKFILDLLEQQPHKIIQYKYLYRLFRQATNKPACRRTLVASLGTLEKYGLISISRHAAVVYGRVIYVNYESRFLQWVAKVGSPYYGCITPAQIDHPYPIVYVTSQQFSRIKAKAINEKAREASKPFIR